MNRMLINATQKEELRVALVSGQLLYDLDIEHAGREQKKANIYKGRITRIEPSLEAVFVDYGADRHGFLPFKEIAPQYLKPGFNLYDRQSMREALKVGQEIMVQIEKEERGSKGAALTTYISLPGCYLVLMPNNPGAGGISRRIEGEERQEMQEIFSHLQIPEDMGLIARTAGVGRSQEELQWDLSVLLKQWEAIKTAFNIRPAPFLIHQESDVVMRAIRDYLRQDVGEILIDNEDVFTLAKKQIELVRPDFVSRVKIYKDPVPLFSRFQIEHQIESAFQREIRLTSGSSIVIDHTEALVSIDINSGKATKGGDIEETALNTNLEAAEEIARQLRLRDLGGLIVIDFIDMVSVRHQREVENRLREALKMDRARVQIGRISRFGLLEMSRQRLRSYLGEAIHKTCPRCNGQGTIRSIESIALSIIRVIEEDALKEKTALIQAQLPIEIATYLLNEKRNMLIQIEQRHRVRLVVIPNEHLEVPHYKINRLRADEAAAQSETTASYDLVEKNIEESVSPMSLSQPISEQQPAVKEVAMPELAPRTKPGLLEGLIKKLFGTKTQQPKPVASKVEERAPRRARSEFAGHHKPKRSRHRSGGDRMDRGSDRMERQERAPRGERPGGDRDRQQGHGGERSERQGQGGRRFHKGGDKRRDYQENAFKRTPSPHHPAQAAQPAHIAQPAAPVVQKNIENPKTAPVENSFKRSDEPVFVDQDQVNLANAIKSMESVGETETFKPRPQKRTTRRFGGSHARRRGFLRTGGGKEGESGQQIIDLSNNQDQSQKTTEPSEKS